MTPYEIADKAQQLVNELGVRDDVTGIADRTLSAANYKELLASYQQILNDVLVLIRELAINVQPDAKLPKPGNFHD